jgi:hypothetical protein
VLPGKTSCFSRNHVKKAKITLKESSAGRKFFLFPSPEALYVWATALEKNEQVVIEGIDELVLEQGSFIEVELTGFEYVYDSDSSLKHKRLDRIRLGLAQQPKNAAGLQVSTHAGWVTGNLMPLKRYSDPDIDVTLIDQAEAKLDLAALFNDDIPVTSDED